MKVNNSSCRYHISKLYPDAICREEVKNSSLTKFLKGVSNSENKLEYSPVSNDIQNIPYQGKSKKPQKKINLLDKIVSCFVKKSDEVNPERLDALQSARKIERSSSDVSQRSAAMPATNPEILEKNNFTIFENFERAFEDSKIMKIYCKENSFGKVEIKKSCLKDTPQKTVTEERNYVLHNSSPAKITPAKVTRNNLFIGKLKTGFNKVLKYMAAGMTKESKPAKGTPAKVTRNNLFIGKLKTGFNKVLKYMAAGRTKKSKPAKGTQAEVTRNNLPNEELKTRFDEELKARVAERAKEGAHHSTVNLRSDLPSDTDY